MPGKTTPLMCPNTTFISENLSTKSLIEKDSENKSRGATTGDDRDWKYGSYAPEPIESISDPKRYY